MSTVTAPEPPPADCGSLGDVAYDQGVLWVKREDPPRWEVAPDVMLSVLQARYGFIPD